MIRYKGYSISAEFTGIGRPDEFVVRQLAPCGNFALQLCGSFERLAAAIEWIDAACINHEVVPREPEWSPYAARSA